MFLIILGASLTLGTALLAVVSFTEGALVASRTAAQVIGWLFVIASLVGLAGLRRASPGQICAVGVTLCSGFAVLYMSYFFEWNQVPRAAIRQAAAETPAHVFRKGIDLDANLTLASLKLIRPAEDRMSAQAPAPRNPLRTAALPAAPSSHPCSALIGVESLQCDRCAGKAGLAWLACRETVRLEFCDSEAGDERTCPSPIPLSHPG